MLSVQPAFEVIGEAGNGEEAIQLALTHRPDVVLMDLRMPVMDGVSATRRLHSLLPQCRVIVLTTFDDDESVFDGLRAGAVGYLLKDVASTRLFEAIQVQLHVDTVPGELCSGLPISQNLWKVPDIRAC